MTNIDIQTSLNECIESYNTGQMQQAKELCHKILEVDPENVTGLYLLGTIYGNTNNNEKAQELISKVIQIIPEFPDAYLTLAIILKNQGNFEGAIENYYKTIALNPDCHEVFYNLGSTFQEQGNLEEAIKNYKKTISLNADYPEAFYNLGVALKELGNLEGAIENYKKTIALNPACPEAFYNLGIALKEQGNLEESIENYQKAIAVKPDYHEAFNNLGSVLQEQGNLEGAIENYKKAIALNPACQQTYNNLGNALVEQGNLPNAIENYKRAIFLKPDFHQAFYNICNILQNNNYIKDAMQLHRNKQFRQLKDLIKINNALLLPPIYNNKQDLLHWRKRLHKNVHKGINDNWEIPDSQLHSVLGTFYLVYQGYNNVKINAHIAKMLKPSIRYVVDNHKQPKIGSEAPVYDPFDQNKTCKKIKIGFISTHFRQHSVTNFYKNLIINIPKDGFQIHVYGTNNKIDPVHETIKEYADNFSLLNSDNIIYNQQLIAGHQLDILVYLDIGMSNITYFLAFTRLATIQCVLMGHPDTTGIPTLDYYISGQIFEIPTAQKHYTEKLIRIKGMPIMYDKPAFPVKLKTKKTLGLDPTGNIYVCPMNPIKLHPDFDEAVAGILEQDPQGIIYFFHIKNNFNLNINERFAKTMPAAVLNRIRFLPQANKDDFLQIIRHSAVVLDTYHFGGGNTSLLALACGTPIVTLPSRYLRARWTYGYYQLIGLPDCIAKNNTEYIRLAVKLGTNKLFRQKIKKAILERNAILFNNDEGVRETIEFFKEVVTQRQI